MSTSQLEKYTELLLEAKDREAYAKATRIQLEEQIAELIPGPETGSKTVRLENGMRVTVKRGWNFKVDVDNLIDATPTTFIPPIKTKTTRELDEKGYRWYEHEHPEIYREISKHVVATPKKVAVEVRVK